MVRDDGVGGGAQKLAKVVKRSDCWRSKDEETASRAGVMRMLRVVPCRSACSARARDALWQVRANYVRNVIVGGLLTSLTVPCTETYNHTTSRPVWELLRVVLSGHRQQLPHTVCNTMVQCRSIASTNVR